jgi:hypothetical protein
MGTGAGEGAPDESSRALKPLSLWLQWLAPGRTGVDPVDLRALNQIGHTLRRMRGQQRPILVQNFIPV